MIKNHQTRILFDCHFLKNKNENILISKVTLCFEITFFQIFD